MSDSASMYPKPGDDPAPIGSEENAGQEASVADELNGPASLNMAAPLTAASSDDDAPPPGAELSGRITEVSGDSVFLDVGFRSRAIVPVAQFGNDTGPEVGASVDVVVDRFDSSADSLFAHRKGAAMPATWETITLGMLLEGRVTGMIKGGLEVQCGAIRGFMPASQVDTQHMKDISVLLSQQVRCEVLEINRKRKSVILSRRRALERERFEGRQKLFDELKPGQVRKGVVGNLTEYGAFVDLGGVFGLIHRRDLSWKPIEKPADVVQPGEEIEVLILKVDRGRQRISLRLRQAARDPWTCVEQDFPPGRQTKARIVHLADFGAFAEVTDGINGLIPLGEMLWSHRPGNASEVVKVGEDVDVVVLTIEPKRRRMSLSMKQVTEDPWAKVAETYPVDSTIKGQVNKLLDFGVLVELHAGVEGLVHISEMSHERVRKPGDIVNVGDEVEVKVLGVDAKRRRISLSIKATAARKQTPMTESSEPKKSKPKRKQPLRGGLTSHFKW
ncbi:MAG: S1 RNA-binding domain-containing protein, partial [Planctomycetes bacterium]|nr:S1 RNA-binding domain-containing protein [Planctomycetota bacterium]